MYGVLTLYDPVFHPSYPRTTAGNAPLDYNSHSEARQHDFQFELFPLHSQLLGESLLVSFPPLIDMLKSSGSSYLISGQIITCDCVGWRVLAHLDARRAQRNREALAPKKARHRETPGRPPPRLR